MEVIAASLEAVGEEDINELIAIILETEAAYIRSQFSLVDTISLFIKVVEQEDIEKLFLGVTALVEKMNSVH